jgi:ASC-1-like (ASCH) protein
MQEIGIEKTLLQSVLIGTKTVEGRLGKPKYLKLRVGDKLKLREDTWQDGKITASRPDVAIATITQLLYFESFAEMFSSINYLDTVPNASTREEALAQYDTFYSVEDELEYGVIAITFTLDE